MRRLKQTLATGIGGALDELGELLDLPRTFSSPDRKEADDSYRARLIKHKLVQLLIKYE